MRGKAGFAGVVMTVVMMIAGVAFAAGHLQPSTTDTQNVYLFADGSDTGGDSFLTRTPGMVLATVEAANLTPGDAYTVWWIVFNNPGACTPEVEAGPPVCGEDDIFTDTGLNIPQVIAAGIGVGNATGNIAKADGTAEFGARLKQDDDSGAHQILFPAGLAGDVLLTAGGNDAEIHLVIQNHGKARGGPQQLSQLAYVETGCTPLCSDVQFTVHKP